MKTYLVTGGAGFIGANFVKYMLREYRADSKLIVLDKLTYAGNLDTLKNELQRIVFIRGDICDQQLVKRIFEKNGIDYVVNFAAESHVDRSIENPQVFLQTNILGTQNLLETARASWDLGNDTYRHGTKFLQVSTDEVYGSLGNTGYFTEDTPLNPRSPYSASKAGADMIVQAYVQTYRFPANITRCSNNYGPYQFPEKLIPVLIRKALEGARLPIYGDGKNVRDWLYVEDHCRAIDKVLHYGRVGEVYNVGGHNEWLNIELAKFIIDVIKELMRKNPGYQSVLRTSLSSIGYGLIAHVEDRKGHDRRYAVDTAKIENELGWSPETSFDEGLIKTVEWYLRNQAWVQDVSSRIRQDSQKDSAVLAK